MSLPTAPRDISDNPRAGAVTDPVNRKQKDADVDRKLRFYGVIEAFRRGNMPDNHQIDETLQYVRDHSPVDVSALSPEGQQLIQNVRDIVETARVIVMKKNADELFQNFMWHTRDVDLSAAKQDPNAIVPVDKGKAQQDGQQAIKHLRTLLNLVLTNAEARKLISDFAVIGRDLFAQGAAKAADMARPDGERLARVDDAAPHNEFVTEGGRRTTDTKETPVLEARIPDPRPGNDGEFTVKQHPHDEIGTGAQIHQPDGTVRSGGEVRDQAQDVAGQAREQAPGLANQGKERAQLEADQVRNEADQVDDPNAKKDVAKGGLKDRVRGMRDNLMGRVPQEHKDKASGQYEDTKNWFKDEYFPEERRDQLIYRAKKVIVECQRHDDYQQAITWLLGFFEEYFGHSKAAAAKGGESHDALRSDSSLTQAMSELRTLIERFADGRSMDDMKVRVQALYDDAQNDDELRRWFGELDGYVRKCLLEPGYVLQDACNADGRQIRDSGRQFYDGKYKSHFDAVFSSIGEFFRGMGDDPLNARFGQDWARLTKNLLFDSESNLKFKPELWGDIRKVILPQLIDQVGYIPIPRVEYTDDSLDLVLENLTLSGRNLFPNVVTLEAHNFIKFSPYQSIKDESHHEFTLNFGQVQADMRDVAFYFHKKTGIPKIKDSGLADVLLGGKGLSATIHLASAGKDTSSVFHVKKVDVHVDTLKFSIRDSKHDALYNTLRPLATGLVKKQIQKALRDALVTGLEYVDGQLVGVRDRMNEAKGTDETTRLQVLKEIFQSKKDEAASVKSKKDEAHGQFKVVAKRDSVLLPDQGHPSGWVNRQQDLSDKVRTGKEWRSDAFTII